MAVRESFGVVSEFFADIFWLCAHNPKTSTYDRDLDADEAKALMALYAHHAPIVAVIKLANKPAPLAKVAEIVGQAGNDAMFVPSWSTNADFWKRSLITCATAAGIVVP